MGMDKNVLYIDIADMQTLQDVYGGEAVTQNLSDVSVVIEEKVKRLLSQHSLLDFKMDLGAPHWMASFEMTAGALLRDFEESRQAIEKATSRVVHESLRDVFGVGASMKMSPRVCLAPLGQDHSGRLVDVQQGWLEPYLTNPSTCVDGTLQGVSAELDDILAGDKLRTFLQPIVSLKDKTLLGYEALVRGPVGSALERPDQLFDFADRVGRTLEVELACARLALERTPKRLPDGQFLTINLGPEALALAEEHLPLEGRENILFEITEHMPLDDAQVLVPVVDKLRQKGVGVALDDTGCGFADLDVARILRPEIVKLCITVIRNADKDCAFLKAIDQTSQELVNLGCRVLAEGVETQSQHDVLQSCPIEYAQGWLYARPIDVADMTF